MSNIELVIRPRINDIGDGFKVRRALPFQKKRMVGPYIFLDHMGPMQLDQDHKLKVRAHPHIGLSTLTYLFTGTIFHRDTLGFEQAIRPGEVNWMTAGRGIAHSERSVPDEEGILEGIQVWIALPKELEDIEPSFVHKSNAEIPYVDVGGASYQLVAGSAFGKSSPVPVHSQLFYLGGEVEAHHQFSMKLASQTEGAVYIAQGKIEVEGEVYEEGALISFLKGTAIDYKTLTKCRLVIVGGEVFPEKRYIFWNFVSSSPEKIEQAKLAWKNKSFGNVIHEDEYIPLPDNNPAVTNDP
jgi:redox-sensitive bicupin YhaK (pirin superfamily)